MKPSSLMIVQGGGPTAVFNASLAEIIATAQKQPRIGKIVGARSGVRGLVENDVVDLTEMPVHELERLRRTPGAALGSSRYKPSEKDMISLAARLRGFDVGHLLFLGGNGTMQGAQRVSDFLRTSGMDVCVVGVPKTVDNDLAETDRSPGFASAARYIATATRELGADVRSLPQPVSILETMGRSVGWLAAATAMARTKDGGAPHLIYLPEIPFEMETFLSDLQAAVKKHGWAVVTIAEGAAYADGRLVYEASDPTQSDPLRRPMTGGVAQHLATVVGKRLKMRCRSEKPGLLGRASMALVSEQDRADATLVGRAAVEAVAAGECDVMVALEPLDGKNPAGYRLAPLIKAAGKERRIPCEWLPGGTVPWGGALQRYLEPLAGPLEEHLVELPKTASIAEAGAR